MYFDDKFIKCNGYVAITKQNKIPLRTKRTIRQRPLTLKRKTLNFWLHIL